jgi:prepilin-type N-terminal cleavage/methylation domain-containing protein
MNSARRNSRGFTLVELAIAIFIIALLLGSILVPLATQIEQRQNSETQKKLEEIRDALLGFAATNGYLPCPDTDNDGDENIDTVTGKCLTITASIAAGNLPWNTLGLMTNSDAWGNRFRYVINDRYGWRTPLAALVTLSGGGTDVRICAAAGCAGSGTAVVAAVISMGKNGYGATNSQTGVANPAPGAVDEQENVDTDREIVSRTPSAVGSTLGEFDDIVISISQYVLFNRMIAAGKLP